jgi:dethiobiotin synthetase
VKPAQTGVATGEETDAATVTRLADPATVRTLAAYPDPLAPLAAARVSGAEPLAAMAAHLGVRAAGRDTDLVLVEGAGGLLVPMGEGWTAADLAVSLGATAVVVVRAGLGTLNHTALTLEALDRRNVPALVVIGAWPVLPELVHRSNLRDLPGQLVGAVPEGAGSLAPLDFRAAAPEWLASVLYGRFTVDGFRAAQNTGTP